ncbi:MAG TPA: DUF4325 domain-containing protein, partial [Tepidisphaeraceae bacterium]|nr:DUF4325 domain-containing protein [Tepidisphaeraceae bacterium]
AGGDRYTGLDEFGRVIDQWWYDRSTTTTLERLQYGYDRDGNILYENNLVSSADSALYSPANGTAPESQYDSLGRLQGFERGTLSSSGTNGPAPDTVSTASATESWSLDALGNWSSFSTNGTAQTRSFNSENQISSISGTTTTPSFDNNGNMTEDEQGHKYVFNAWNQIVDVENTSSTVLESYGYDALGRRITSTAGSTTTNLYYGSSPARRAGCAAGHRLQRDGRVRLADDGGGVWAADRREPGVRDAGFGALQGALSQHLFASSARSMSLGFSRNSRRHPPNSPLRSNETEIRPVADGNNLQQPSIVNICAANVDNGRRECLQWPMKHQAKEIREFVVSNVRDHSEDIVSLAAEKFQVSRQAVHRHVSALVDRGVLRASGNTRNRSYELVTTEFVDLRIELVPGLEEHAVWEESLRPKLSGLRKNIDAICHYGFTEMFNNVIDHSEGSKSIIHLQVTAADVVIWVADDGVGIFNKVAKALNLPEPRESLLELSKGKFTTDPKHHTGEGIFFTSRVFDNFYIISGDLMFVHNKDEDDWLIESATGHVSGTRIVMEIGLMADQTLETIFGKFSGGETNDYGFSKTHVPLRLARFGHENLVSRSQAKRVLMRFDRFDEIILDFDGIEVIGQGFADEIFRVFALEHPNIKLYALKANSQVQGMIDRARLESARPLPAQEVPDLPKKS